MGGLCVIGATVALTGVTSDLFGQPPVSTARIAAEPEQVAVVDGETLSLNGVVVRLSGIEAPARGDECRPGLDCGGAASSNLAELVRNRKVECDLQTASNGRPIGSCSTGAADLSRLVVEHGWARALRADLAGPEQAARAARRGLWASNP